MRTSASSTSGRLYARDGISPEVWGDIVDGANESLVFHRNEWLEVLADVQGAPLKRYGLYADADATDLVGVMPVFIGRYGPFHVAGSPLVVEDTPYMGPVVAEELLPSALLAIRDCVKREATFFRTLLPHALSEKGRSMLTANGFLITTKHTHRLDLSPGTSVLWDQMEGRCRTAVRRARKGRVEVRRIRDATEDQIRDYFALVKAVFDHQQRKPPNPLEFFLEIRRRVQPLGGLSLVLAERDGEVIAGAVLAHDRHRVYYIDGASDYEHRKLNASNLVLWEAVEWAAEEGRKEFDFVGSDIPRLARFKKSFGGELVEHSCVEWARSRIVWMARDWWGRTGRGLLNRLRHARHHSLPWTSD